MANSQEKRLLLLGLDGAGKTSLLVRCFVAVIFPGRDSCKFLCLAGKIILPDTSDLDDILTQVSTVKTSTPNIEVSTVQNSVNFFSVIFLPIKKVLDQLLICESETRNRTPDCLKKVFGTYSSTFR